MTTIEAPRAVNAPTSERPYWHDEGGERLAFGDVLVAADPEEERGCPSRPACDASGSR